MSESGASHITTVVVEVLRTAPAVVTPPGVDPPAEPDSMVFLDWSDDRGRSYGNPVGQSMGGTGEYITSVQWQRLGMARDRVFRISWSVNAPTCLQGAWIEATPAVS